MLEFALIVPVFLTLIFAVIDFSLLYFEDSELEAALATAARQVRVGSLGSGSGVGAFRTAVCDQLLLTDCDDITFNVRSFESFDDAAAAEDPDWEAEDETFDTGGAEDVVLVTVTYVYNFVVPPLAFLIENGTPEGAVTLISTTIARNEPFD